MKLKLIFWSSPKAIQSVRFARIGKFVRRYQPSQNIEWKNWIRMQAKGQLADNFRIINDPIIINKLHFIFAPLKNFPKYKIKSIEDGDVIYKSTKPDLVDNLSKGLLDALNGILWQDDSQIVAAKDIQKYYGLEPRIELEIETIEEVVKC